jgi:hypothetical protein
VHRTEESHLRPGSVSGERLTLARPVRVVGGPYQAASGGVGDGGERFRVVRQVEGEAWGRWRGPGSVAPLVTARAALRRTIKLARGEIEACTFSGRIRGGGESSCLKKSRGRGRII